MTSVSLGARLRYLARRAGWPALAGTALLAGAAVMEFDRLPAAREKLAGVRDAIGKARAERNAPRHVMDDAASLLATLPERDALESLIASIHQTAAAQGLSTGGAEYRSRKEAGGEILRQEITLPLKGAPAPLRAWLTDLRAQQPALAIEQLSLHRLAAESTQVEGRLRLALFLRARSAPATASTTSSATTSTTATGTAAVAAATPPADGGAAAPVQRPQTVEGLAAADLFATRSWQPPPPSPPPPPKPTAPPLPFKYAGKLIEDKTVRIFLSQGTATTLVKQGDQLGNYDIERVTTSSVVLRYRPLQEQQTLNFGGFD